MQSTENDDKAIPADVMRTDFDVLEHQASLFLLRKTEDELHAALSALEDQESLALISTSALAAERDRADRAEAALVDAPHQYGCRVNWAEPGPCDCWKSEATA